MMMKIRFDIKFVNTSVFGKKTCVDRSSIKIEIYS